MSDFLTLIVAPQGPMFERATAALEPDIRLLKLNADEAPEVTGKLGVRGIPALFLFRGGEGVTQTAGTMSADAIIGWARKNLAVSAPRSGAV